MSIKVEGIKQAVKALENYKDSKHKRLVDATQKAAIMVESKAKQNIAVDTGDTRASIQRRSNDLDGEVYTNKKTAPFLEFGTGSKVEIPKGLEGYAAQFKGSGEGNFNDMIENLTAWANRKGIPEDAVYPIALKILREGIEAQPFLFPAWESVRPWYIKEAKKILRSIR